MAIVAPVNNTWGDVHDIRKRADMVRSIEFEQILKRIGGSPHGYDKAKWHTPRGELSISGQRFFDWTTRGGGGGAIDLVIYLMDYDFKSAVDWLCHHFPQPGASPVGASSHGEWKRESKSESEASRTLELPQRDDSKLPKICQYLIHQRCLPTAILHYLVSRGIVYADHRSNVVFLLLGKEKRVVGAEIRGTKDHRRKWHAMASGSQKEQGCFYLRAKGARKAVLCESAIDAISYFVLYPNCLAISTAGANPKPSWLPVFMDKGWEIYCGFDADKTGDRMAEIMLQLYPGIKRLRPEKKDWNEVLKARLNIK